MVPMTVVMDMEAVLRSPPRCTCAKRARCRALLPRALMVRMEVNHATLVPSPHLLTHACDAPVKRSHAPSMFGTNSPWLWARHDCGAIQRTEQRSEKEEGGGEGAGGRSMNRSPSFSFFPFQSSKHVRVKGTYSVTPSAKHEATACGRPNS